MVWECECPLGGRTDMLTAFLGRLAKPWAVQAVWEETCGAVLETDTGCGSGDGAAAATLGCGVEPAFWHWSSKLDGGRLSPPPALHLQHVPLSSPRTHSVTGTSKEAWWVLWWLPSLGRVLQHPGVSGAGWDGTAASGLAGHHGKPCTAELISTRTKGSLGVKITLEKQSQSPVMESLSCSGCFLISPSQPKVPPFRPACTVRYFFSTHEYDDITRTTGTIFGTSNGLYCPAQACFLKSSLCHF